VGFTEPAQHAVGIDGQVQASQHVVQRAEAVVPLPSIEAV
jgi:hypothetical protein